MNAGKVKTTVTLWKVFIISKIDLQGQEPKSFMKPLLV